MRAAERAAEQAFRKKASLPFRDEETSGGKVEEGRRRLKGAFLINTSRIEPDPDQPRKKIDPTYLTELTASVKRLGILQPITVRYVADTDRYRIIAGECRFTAAKNAYVKEVPCWVKDSKKEQILLEQIVENWQRSDLNPFELADSLAILRDANGFTQVQLAEHTGKSKAEISKLLSILDLEPDVQKLARDDTTRHVSKRHLFALARLDAEVQKRTILRIQRDNLTALDTERYVTRRLEKEKKSDKRGPEYMRRRFVITRATALFTFRKTNVTDQDVLDAVSEIKEQIKRENES